MAKRSVVTQGRTPLNRERVLRAALALADADGLEALSMRRLAKRLRVEAMSLYNHVANKEEILAGIIDLVVGEIDLPAGEPEWKAALRRNAISAKDAFLRHPWASNLMLAQQSSGPAQMRRADWMLRTLREAGLSEEHTYHAFHVLEAYIVGITVQHLSFPYEGQELRDLATSFLQRLPADGYPDLVHHIRQHVEPDPALQGGFELGLDLILEGLERLRDQTRAGSG
jgi:AcrR family transcriptional regulator